MADENDKEILIPEVLPPVRGEERRQAWREPPPEAEQGERVRAADRVANFLGPIVSGVLLDAFHMAPRSKIGFVIGAVLGFWFARVCGLRLKVCLLVALVSAFYPGVPGKFLPVATLVGVYFAVRNNRQRNGGGR